MTNTCFARVSAGTAIAAALALSSTAGLAQEAQPTTADSSELAAQPDPSPAATDSTTPAAADSSTSQKTSTVKHAKHVTAAKPASVATRATTRTMHTHATIPIAAVPTVAAAASPAAPAAPAKVKPIVDVNAKPANASPATAKPLNNPDETAMIGGGGALALLLLGGGAYALARRRRSSDEAFIDKNSETADEPGTMGRYDPIFEHEPPMVAPSAFAWGNPQHASLQAAKRADDRRPGETWVKRAYRGPSAENPSLSLRKRLKRAAFFDKREREVAAGKAEPVEVDAGLPENVPEPGAAGQVRKLEAA